MSARSNIQKSERYPARVEWGIGSMVGAIIYVAGTTAIRELPQVAMTATWFSIACLVLYLFHPKVAGLFGALEKRISPDKNIEEQRKVTV